MRRLVAPRPAASVSARWRSHGVVGVERRREAALRPVARRLRERRARHEHDARAAAGRDQGGVEAGRSGADHGDVGGLDEGRGDHRAVRYPPRAAPPGPTDPMTRGLYLHHPSSLEHDTGDHPERAARIRGDRAGARAGADGSGSSAQLAPAADRDALEAVHPPAYVDRIAEVSARGGGMLDMDTVASARLVRGGAARGGRRGERRRPRWSRGRRRSRSAACARPGTTPRRRGRWASACSTTSPSRPGMRSTGSDVERVLVLDWDVHHGNGTNDIFYESDEVLYVEHPPVAAVSGHGRADGQRRRRGRGLHGQPARPAGRRPRRMARPRRARGRARSRVHTRPDLLLVSAGFDAHRDDPLANCTLTEESYAAMAAAMRTLSRELDAPLGFVLEGGYDLDALAASVAATIEGALDGPRRRPGRAGPARRPRPRPLRRWWPLALDPSPAGEGVVRSSAAGRRTADLPRRGCGKKKGAVQARRPCPPLARLPSD